MRWLRFLFFSAVGRFSSRNCDGFCSFCYDDHCGALLVFHQAVEAYFQSEKTKALDERTAAAFLFL